MFILDAKDVSSLESYLKVQGWFLQEERVNKVSIPGEGNMNYVLRISTPDRSFIVKQSREYVEKYPHVSAPADRVLMEAAFYQTTNADPLISKFTPEMIGIDRTNNIMALEDLGTASDFMFLYQQSRVIDISQLAELTDFLTCLHMQFPKMSGGESFKNWGMRTLNHAHIFLYPFAEENGFDLDSVQPGLQAAAADFKNDDKLKQEVGRLGQLYLSEGNCLLHGDFYPGSWLETSSGIKIIDPEFCFYGPAEFDLGVMIAHLYLAGQTEAMINFTKDRFSSYLQLDNILLNQFVGVEIMRRLIGLAQLPLSSTISQKRELLKFARGLIVT